MLSVPYQFVGFLLNFTTLLAYQDTKASFGNMTGEWPMNEFIIHVVKEQCLMYRQV
jgi:hypothetical protein